MILILSGNKSKAPYVNFYNKFEVSTVVEWNRNALATDADYSFKQVFGEEFSGYLSTLKSYYKYAIYVKSVLAGNKDQNVVIFNVVNFIFLSIFCYSELKVRRVIFDLRDFSTHFRFYKFLLKFLLMLHKTLNVYSSPQFKREMSDEKGIISHNVQSVKASGDQPNELINVATLGSIRDLQENFEVAKATNELGLNVAFHGEGPCKNDLEKLCKQHGIAANFTGYFIENEKNLLLKQADVINNYNRNDFNGSRLLSNRFYMAIFTCKPQIVNKSTFQGQLAIAHGVGFDLNDMGSYVSNWSKATAHELSFNCRRLVNEILRENEETEKKIHEYFN